MKNSHRFSLHPSIGLALVYLASGAALLAQVEDTVQRSFQVGSGGLLTLRADLGSVRVQSHPGDTVEVEVRRRVRGSAAEAEEVLRNLRLDIQQRGGDVSVEAEYQRRLFSWGRNPLSLEFNILVPSRYNLDLRTSGGTISVSDLEGEIRAGTSGGSLRFGSIRGPVQARTSGGNIELAGSEGRAEVSTSGGSIRIGEVAGDVTAKTSGGSISISRARGSVTAETSGGSIKVEDVSGHLQASTSGGSVTATISEQPRDGSRLATSGGSVNLYLAEHVGLDVDARTSGGRVVTDFPITVQGVLERTSMRGSINGGGPSLTLRTSGGNIHLRRLER